MLRVELWSGRGAPLQNSKQLVCLVASITPPVFLIHKTQQRSCVVLTGTADSSLGEGLVHSLSQVLVEGAGHLHFRDPIALYVRMGVARMLRKSKVS